MFFLECAFHKVFLMELEDRYFGVDCTGLDGGRLKGSQCGFALIHKVLQL